MRANKKTFIFLLLFVLLSSTSYIYISNATLTTVLLLAQCYSDNTNTWYLTKNTTNCTNIFLNLTSNEHDNVQLKYNRELQCEITMTLNIAKMLKYDYLVK